MLLTQNTFKHNHTKLQNKAPALLIRYFDEYGHIRY